MDASTIRVMKAIAISVAAPVLLYLLIYRHFGCQSDGEQMAAGILGFVGMMAAIRWA